MKIALAQQNYIIGDFEFNTRKIISAIEEAEKLGADIIVFTELCICGYPPRDFLEFKDFISRCEQAVKEVAKHSQKIAVVVGAPSVNPKVQGKDLFNTAFFLYEGEIKFKAHKTLLPTYDVFDEVRYFESNTDFGAVDFKGRKIGLTICEDLWNTGDNPLYTRTTMDELIKHHPDLIINISASPFDYNHAEERIQVLKDVTTKYHLPVFYCNTVGGQTELLFDGGSLVVNSKGIVASEMTYFKEEIKVFDLDEIEKAKQEQVQPKNKTALIHDALVYGIKDYFSKLKFDKAILGLSGGIDSAVVLALAAEALDKDNVVSVLMPSEFSSSHSVTDAEELCRNLQVKYEKISISEIYNQSLSTLKPFLQNKPFDVTEENIQARIRAILLMALSNKHHYILLNTSNKSEASVGYGTLYGDMSGGLSVLGDIYKTEVYELANYINRNKKIIPQNIIDKTPSAELREGQKDSDSLPEYNILDKVLYNYIELRKGPRELVEMDFEKSLVDRILKLVNTNEYKRYQTPPVLRVSPKAFGSGRRLPIVGKYLS